MDVADSVRALAASAGIQFGDLQTEAFRLREKLGPDHQKAYCTKCGSHISVDHPTLGLIDVRIGALRNFPFKPKVHLNYQETVLPMKDGLTEVKGFPARRSAGRARHCPNRQNSVRSSFYSRQFRHTRPSARLRLVTRLFLRSVSAAASLQRAKLESQSCASTDFVGSAMLDRL